VRVQAGTRPTKRKAEAAMCMHELVMKARQDEFYAAAPKRQAGEPSV
jgi:hypothetical protein